LIAAFGALGAWALTGVPDARQSIVAIWCAGAVGACLGFLWFNSAPASVFLGDVGALGLGGALGVLALLANAALALVIIGGVFVAEAVSVMLQVASYRWRNKRRIFRVAPLHHHFHVGGMTEPKLVVRFWIAGALLAALGITALARA
jgi:phospho-N-acetylmuramoyl-pentapeptide-transferase